MAPCKINLVSELASRRVMIAGGVLAAMLQPQSSCDHWDSGERCWAHMSGERVSWFAVRFRVLQHDRGLGDADLVPEDALVSDWRAASLA